MVLFIRWRVNNTIWELHLQLTVLGRFIACSTQSQMMYSYMVPGNGILFIYSIPLSSNQSPTLVKKTPRCSLPRPPSTSLSSPLSTPHPVQVLGYHFSAFILHETRRLRRPCRTQVLYGCGDRGPTAGGLNSSPRGSLGGAVFASCWRSGQTRGNGLLCEYWSVVGVLSIGMILKRLQC